MPFPKVCAYAPCSKSFVAVQNAIQFCSNACRIQSRKTRLVKECANEECRKSFIAHRPAAKYCSAKCMGFVRKHAQKDMRAYLMSHIQIPDSREGCWIWTGHLNESGYGMASNRGARRAHRVVYEIFVGPIPEHMDVLHGETCTTRACVNPFHLRIGTNQENIQDRIKFGNHLRGSRAPSATFTEMTALHILKEFHEQGLTIEQITKKRGRSVNTIRDVIYRRTWKHVAPGLYPSPQNRPGFNARRKTLAELPHALCGSIFCDYCGECRACHGTQPCYASENRLHVFP